MEESDDTEYLIRCTVCGLDEDYSGPTIVGDTICPNEECGHPLARHTISVSAIYPDEHGNFEHPRFK
jgi:hypothetical protein